LKLAIQGQEYKRDFATLTQQGISRSARSAYDFTSFSIGRLDAAIALLIAYTEIAFGVMQAELLYQKS
jgi:hypothetical protein